MSKNQMREWNAEFMKSLKKALRKTRFADMLPDR